MRPRRVEPGLHLVIGDAGRIRRSAPIRHAPREGLQRPFLNDKTARGLTEPLIEVVLDILRKDGRVEESFGWPWVAEVFYDRPFTEAYREQPAGRIAVRDSLRVLRVPIAPGAAFLLFSQVEVVLGRDGTSKGVRRNGLTLYSLGSPKARRPPLPKSIRRLEVWALPGEARLSQSF